MTGYRKKVVLMNLTNSFPEKDSKEIELITRKFYKNLADIIVEIIKLRGIKPHQLLDRFKIQDLQILNNIFKLNKSAIITIGHCGNWDWMGAAIGHHIEPKGYAVVKPLSNKRFDNYLNNIRIKGSGGGVIPFKDTFRTLIKLKKELTATVFAADQTPTKGEINYWTTFLNQDTPFFLGIEKIAKVLDMGVVFLDIQRKGRGRYFGVFHLITNIPKETAEHEITENYVTLLETSIKARPDNWMWSHKRWKHKRESQPDTSADNS